jgi:hypothetical protein
LALVAHVYVGTGAFRSSCWAHGGWSFGHFFILHFGVISAHPPLGGGVQRISIVLCVMGPGSLEVFLHVIFGSRPTMLSFFSFFVLRFPLSLSRNCVVLGFYFYHPAFVYCVYLFFEESPDFGIRHPGVSCTRDFVFIYLLFFFLSWVSVIGRFS